MSANKPIKPICKLTGENGNVYNLIGTAQSCLKLAGQKYNAKEMADRCLHAEDYDHVLSIIGEYVDIK
jgi:hypothetical protein